MPSKGRAHLSWRRRNRRQKSYSGGGLPDPRSGSPTAYAPPKPSPVPAAKPQPAPASRGKIVYKARGGAVTTQQCATCLQYLDYTAWRGDKQLDNICETPTCRKKYERAN